MAPIPKNGDGPKAACIGSVVLPAIQAEVVVVTWPHSHSRKAHRATSVLHAECGATIGVVGPRCLQHHIDIIVGSPARCALWFKVVLGC